MQQSFSYSDYGNGNGRRLYKDKDVEEINIRDCNFAKQDEGLTFIYS